MHDTAALKARLERVRERMADAARRAGRPPSSIRLIAVSKTFPPDAVRAAFDTCGQIDFGENKVQEGLAKMESLSPLPLRWHLLGHLQSNKVGKAAARFHAVHSVDQVALLLKLDRSAADAGRSIEVFLQVDLAGEPTKHGAKAEELEPILAAAEGIRSARVKGLMLLPPIMDRAEDARPYFAALRELRDRLVSTGADPSCLSELSMGMSADFEVAIEEGATVVRVGSAIFGPRPWGPTPV